MGKVRVYELARELGTNSKKLIDVMKSMNVSVKNHMSTLDREQAEKVIAIITGQTEAKPDKKEEVAAPAPEEKAEKVPVPVVEGEEVIEEIEEEPAEKAEEEVPSPGRKARKALLERQASAAARKRKQRRKIKLEGRVTVREMASYLEVPAAELIGRLLQLGVVASINQEISPEAMELVADDYEVDLEHTVDPMEQELKAETRVEGEGTQARVPVVTVLGHVDHGKTSLLDAIRKANVTAGEAGGITQHIGAYGVEVQGKKVVFLDTPGHEAFTAMRARGAQVTDIAVLVIGADDGVMPQTIEAINHARAAGVPIIVAVNKIDKPTANLERVKQQLAEHNLVPEEWGGDTIVVSVSALKGEGISELLEMILLMAEVSELSANPDLPARGTVIEARLDRGRGPVATVLVQDGTLRVTDAVICGSIPGRVRAMIDEQGKRVKTAGPSTPVEVLGLADVPQAGDSFQVVGDDRMARQMAEKRSLKLREAAHRMQRVSLKDLFKQIQEGEVEELNLIIKGDVHGSVEALQESLLKLSLEEVKLKVIHAAVGSISESDIMLATASNAIVIGFNVRPEPGVQKMAEQENVDLRLYNVIYEAIEDIEGALSGMLAPEMEEAILGYARVRQLFKVSRLGTIAGCLVTEGKITRNARVRLLRNKEKLFEGKLASLKRFKDDVREVLNGYECGILLDGFHAIEEDDIIEAYVIQEVKK
ncbi:MAG: translation initiation factor IF-2 [Firmicutes bacterium]|nr:translation initiation factor IF-2 [Bacillota bacterium]